MKTLYRRAPPQACGHRPDRAGGRRHRPVHREFGGFRRICAGWSPGCSAMRSSWWWKAPASTGRAGTRTWSAPASRPGWSTPTTSSRCRGETDIGDAHWLAELGRFGLVHRLASWAALCPGDQESTAKRQSGKTRKGNSLLRYLLCEAANAARRTKSVFASKYQGLAIRRGHKKAIVALAHQLIRTIYVILTRREPYRDSGIYTQAAAVSRMHRGGSEPSRAIRCGVALQGSDCRRCAPISGWGWRPPGPGSGTGPCSCRRR